MDYSQSIWFFVIWSVLLRTAEMKYGIRNKRILFGQSADDNNRDAYDVFRYYVYLAQGDIVENPSWWRRLWHGVEPSTSDLVCGGGLLTPLIVQTACHCLARYSRPSNGIDNFTYVWPKNVWEDRIYSFFGSNEVKEMSAIVGPKRYIVYQRCRKLKRFGFSLLDYGLIINKEPVNVKAPDAALSYAPAYNAEDISKYYYDALKKEFMCLHIGHGYWDMKYNDNTYRFTVVPEASELQKWGWRTVMSYKDCMSSTYTPMDRMHRRPFFNYTRDASWVCFKVFKETSKYDYNYGEGDSGGPVSCNGVYFAVVTMSESVESENVVSYASPIIHTLFENAADKRADFLTYVNRFFISPDVPGATDFPHPRTVYPEFVPTPPVHIRSRSPGTIHLHLSIPPPATYILCILSSKLMFQ